MRHLRWKRLYNTGDAQEDAARRRLVETLNGLSDAAAGTEHCQDLNAVHEKLRGLTGEALAKSADEQPLKQLARRIDDFALEEFPLAARGTPACRECGLCDRLQHDLEKWAAEHGTPERRERPEEYAPEDPLRA